MGAMTVQNLRDYVRNALDSDSDEFPDSVVDVWMNQAINRVQRVFEPWNLYEKSWSFTSNGAQNLAFSAIGGDVEVIQSVEAPRWLLRYLPHEAAVAKYAWSQQTGGLTVEFSTFNNTLFLWPQPASGDAYVVRGYRAPTAAVAPTDNPDLPNDFHPLLGEYMLSKALEKQGDFFIAPTKRQEFEQELEALRRRFMRAQSAGVTSIGQGRDVYPFFAERLAYSWE